MMRPYWAGETSRQIRKRIVVEGELMLLSPAHFGNGDSDDLTDMPLLVDPGDGKTPLLTGASVAGALRSYLREREHGYAYAFDCNDRRQKDVLSSSASIRLFGSLKQDDEGEQSPLIIDDALGSRHGIELRDGVAIDGASRTAADKTKFDLQLWQAGTRFRLRFELVVRADESEVELRRALATALNGFNDGGITLGARKRRGYGKVQATHWRIREFDLQTAGGLRDWLLDGGKELTVAPIEHKDLATAWQVDLVPDHRHSFVLEAVFELEGSLLIRSGSGEDDSGPDMVHLHARQSDGTRQPILSGTSLAGALRARASKVANTLDQSPSGAYAATMVQSVFGQTSHSSRLRVEEQVIQGGTNHLVQNRVSIDRFTGGARESALFNQQPVFGNAATRIKIVCKLRIPHDETQADAEIGMLLHLLKDLWTSDMAVGGECSVGRGRLQGQSATLTLLRHDQRCVWQIRQEANKLALSGEITSQSAVTAQSPEEVRMALERFANAFWKQMRPIGTEVTYAA